MSVLWLRWRGFNHLIDSFDLPNMPQITVRAEDLCITARFRSGRVLSNTAGVNDAATAELPEHAVTN